MTTRISHSTRWAALGLVIVAIALGLMLLNQPNDSKPKDVDARYTVTKLDRTLSSGAAFSVRYSPRSQADAERLRPPLAIELERGNRPQYVLIAEYGGRPARVRPAGRPFTLPDVEIAGAGAFTFTLPKLERGDYRLCGAVGFVGTGTGQLINDKFCKSIRVS